MTPEDLELVRTRVRPTWRPDMRCADCLGPPTCPPLLDVLWRSVWSSREPAAPRRCDCAAWDEHRRVVRRVTVARPAKLHYEQCDLARPHRRELLCLECAELRLGRPITPLDLSACLVNYYAARLFRDVQTVVVHAPREGDAELLRRLADLDRVVSLSTPTARDLAADPYRSPPPAECAHGVTFDQAAAASLAAREIRERWPRLDGECPLGCGFIGIAYASKAHYVFGDW